MIVEKRCPRCKQYFNVDTQSEKTTHETCGITYDVYHPTTESRKLNHVGGIALKYVPEKKECTCCNQIKPIDEFKKYSHSSDLHSSWCKECTSKQNKLNYNRDKTLKHKTKDIRGIPQVSVKAPLSSVLSHLIKISSKGYHSDKILKESICEIKETINESAEAGN